MKDMYIPDLYDSLGHIYHYANRVELFETGCMEYAYEILIITPIEKILPCNNLK